MSTKTNKNNSPIERGFEKFKLSRAQHNEILSNRKCNTYYKIIGFYRKDRIELYYKVNLIGKFVAIVSIPFIIMIDGLRTLKDIRDDFRLIFSRKHKDLISLHIASENMWGVANENFLQLEEIYLESRK